MSHDFLSYGISDFGLVHHGTASVFTAVWSMLHIQLIHKPNSDNTIQIVCNEGWELSMRIHSASLKVEPSLKFDVNLISLPSSIYAQSEPW